MSADFDNNGSVGASDLTTWRASYHNNAGGDADGDGDTDGNDYQLWQQQLGLSVSVLQRRRSRARGLILAMVGGALATAGLAQTPFDDHEHPPTEFRNAALARSPPLRATAHPGRRGVPAARRRLARGGGILLVSRPSASGTSDRS